MKRAHAGDWKFPGLPCSDSEPEDEATAVTNDNRGSHGSSDRAPRAIPVGDAGHNDSEIQAIDDGFKRLQTSRPMPDCGRDENGVIISYWCTTCQRNVHYSNWIKHHWKRLYRFEPTLEEFKQKEALRDPPHIWEGDDNPKSRQYWKMPYTCRSCGKWRT